MHDQDNRQDDEDDIEFVSKSQLKREAEALQKIGEKLVEMSDARLSQVPMPDDLIRAVAECRKIKARGGRRRQLQFIGKLMRGIDADPIIAAIEKLEGNDQAETRLLHRCETWRDKLIEEGDSALGQLVEEQPDVDRQLIRSLIRNAKQEQKRGKPPASARKLFKELRSLFG